MFFNELFGTFLLVLVILSVTDKRNGKTRPIEVNAAIIGITVGIVSFSFGGEYRKYSCIYRV